MKRSPPSSIPTVSSDQTGIAIAETRGPAAGLQTIER